MKHKLLLTTSLLCLLGASCAEAQTATGTGIGVSESNSAAGAVAVNRGNGNSRSTLIVNTPANTTATVNQNLSGTTTSNINTNGLQRTELTGTSTVKNVPTAVAPSLAAAGIETCLGSVSGGGSIVGFGGSFGTTVPDPGCQARLDSRTLWSMGLKSAAVARLCLREDIYRSMPDICERYRPAGVPAGYGVVTLQAPVELVAPARGIQVVDGRTGLTRTCDDYNETRHKCLQWAGESRVASAPPARRHKSTVAVATAHSGPTWAAAKPVVSPTTAAEATVATP
jgi:hypothetical protein